MYKRQIEHGPFPIYYEISARLEDDHFTDCIINDKKPEFTPTQAKEAIYNILLSYLSAKEERLVSRKDIDKIYNSIGTKTILEGLEKAVHNNCE